MKKQFYNIESLKAIPISKVVERWGGHLRRVGCRQVTCCPCHEDEHPSLTLYETGGENRCYCFACGQGGSAIDYVMAKEGTDFKGACELLAGTFGSGGLVVGSPCVQSVQSGRQKEEKEVVYVPREWVEQRVSVENSFCKCLMQMFDRHLVEHLTEEYLIGCYDNGVHEDCVLFPSIDVEGRVRNVKVQHYCTDPQSAQFAHGDKRCCYWLGTTLAREGVADRSWCFPTAMPSANGRRCCMECATSPPSRCLTSATVLLPRAMRNTTLPTMWWRGFWKMCDVNISTFFRRKFCVS